MYPDSMMILSPPRMSPHTSIMFSLGVFSAIEELFYITDKHVRSLIDHVENCVK